MTSTVFLGLQLYWLEILDAASGSIPVRGYDALMRNQLNCTELCLNRGSASLAAFIALPEQPARQVTAARTPAQELRAARLQGIQAGASEQAVWLWIAGSALVTLALSFLG